MPELYVNYLKVEKILIAVINSASERKIIESKDIIAKKLPVQLGLNLNFTDFALTYFDDGLALCLWSQNVDLQEAVLVSALTRYALADFKNWNRVRMVIGGCDDEAECC